MSTSKAVPASTIRRVLVVVSVAALAAASLAIGAAPASATGTTHYVNSSSSSCSDSGAGTSTSTPWCTLTRASGTYGAGDQILIADGSSYTNQPLTISGSGSAASPAAIGTYGSGAQPILSQGGDATKADILLENPSYWSVSGLALTNAGVGVVADYRSSYPGSETGNTGLTFSNLLVTNIAGITAGVPNGNGSTSSLDCSANNYDLWQSGGVAVSGSYSPTIASSTYFVSGVSISDVEGHNNLDVVNIDNCDGQVGNPSAPNPARPWLVRNVNVDNMWAYDGDGSGYANQCNEGVRFDGVTGLRVVNSRLDRLGACSVTSGTAAVILVTVSNAVFANDVFSDVPSTSSPDQTGVDNEIYDTGISYRDNLFARNAGAAMEYLRLRCGVNDYQTNTTVTGNVFYGNAESLRRLDSCGSGETPFSGTINDNVTADGSFTDPQSLFAPLIPSGAVNLSAAPDSTPHYAADEFSPVAGFDGWTYQTTTNVSNASAWTSAAFADHVDLSGAWQGTGSGAGEISRFEQTTGSCSGCATARVWTAPSTGRIAIRSLALKSEAGGGAVTAQITRNGTAIAGPTTVAASDTSGQELNADLDVVAGDVLRFSVAGSGGTTGDFTSWTPSITYVPATASSQAGALANGSFETPSISAGSFSYAPTGASWIFSPQTSTAGAGIASNGSGFGNPVASDGSQVAFLQWGGSASESVSGLQPGQPYALSFDIAERAGNTQTVKVLVDGAVVYSVTPSSLSFTRVTTPTFTANGAAHTIQLLGTATSDQTAFVDNVKLEAASDGALANSGFESPAGVAGIANAPTGASWTFSPAASNADAGIVANGSAFGNANAQGGIQAAFLQELGSMSQSVTGLTSGTQYVVEFSAAQRFGNAQALQLQVNGTTVSSVTPTGTAYQEYASAPFVASAASATIAIAGTTTSDNTAFIDNVRILKTSGVASANSSFESPSLASGAYQYGAPVTDWLVQPLESFGSAGITSNGSAFGQPSAPDGSQVALVQREGSLSSATGTGAWLTPGHGYEISFSLANRSFGSQQTLRFEIDGRPIASFSPTTSFTRQSVYLTVPPGQGGQLEIVGTIAGKDTTAFVDNLVALQTN